MKLRSSSALIVAAALLLGVTGCIPADPDESGPSMTSGPSACLLGAWDADLDDLAAQIQQQLIIDNAPVTGTTADGTETVTIGEDGTIAFDMDFTITVTAENAGDTMTLTQTHQGPVTATWAIEDDSVVYSDFDDSDYEVETTQVLNGEPVDPIFTVTGAGAASNVPTRVACGGDQMTTAPAQAPFITTWHRQ